MAARMSRSKVLTDAEAAQQLRKVVLAACEGVKDVTNDRAYQSARKQFIGRREYADVVPDYIRTNRDLTALWYHLREISSSRAERGAKAAQSLELLIERADGRTKAPVPSASWTGKQRTASQQAAIVLSIGPTAFQAVEMLLEEQEGARHNQAPGDDPERDQAIAKLRDLHAALGELLNLAQASRPLTGQMKRVRAARDAVLGWSKDTFTLMLGQSPLMATSAVYGSAIWFATNLVTRNIEASATASAGMLGAGVALKAIRERGETKQGLKGKEA